MAKRKSTKVDGLDPQQRQKIASAIRLVWHRSTQRKLAVARAIDADGFAVCEKCGARVPKVFIDHIEPVGNLLSPGAIERLFVSSKGLQALCKECHKVKTKEDKQKGKI